MPTPASGFQRNSSARSGRGAGTRLARWAAALALALPAAASAASCPPIAWPLWQDFQRRFMQADGRVIDPSVPQQHSTSEGQSYAMFFALVANDPAAFERAWRWSVDNLAQGDAAGRLPAWQWGRREDGTWGLLDANAASDADLWFAYALAEAARLWKRPDYARDARALLARIAADEVAELPGLGKMLLPGPAGFELAGPLWRLNPSYLPLPVLRRLAQFDQGGPWRAIAANTVKMVEAVSPKGFVADWVAYQAPAGAPPAFAPDPEKGAVGSYDAIRNYLWAGMTAPADAAARPMLRTLSGMEGAIAEGVPPESVDAATGAVKGQGPVGFSAALLPYLAARGAKEELERQRARVRAQLPAAPHAPPEQAPRYYDYVLGLFGTGWDEQRYRFLSAGTLKLSWEKACPHAATR
ncbi:endo-1,4-D-glucanase [Pigmentiphaga sp. NML080357]|nr:cellulose synthase complex periplasmic endoglucanase BcsZ [Pigmentiphaga sp. NML080357]OVZ57748.1 endo-1,4-D-glucanase [Pigmentiphaga sp. NML080357]